MDVAIRALGLKKESELTDAKYFYYPRLGFGRIAKRMEEEIIKSGGSVLTDAKPESIGYSSSAVSEVSVKTNNGTKVLPCDLLISSIPIDSLLAFLGSNGKYDFKNESEISKRLQYRSAFLVYIFLRQKTATNYHWIFFPERDVIFSRIFEQKRISGDMCPKERTVLCCDFTDYEDGNLCRQTDDQLLHKCAADLGKIGIIKKSSVEKGFVKRLPRFYPRYDFSYKDTVAQLYGLLKKIDNLLLTGRIGFYNYNNSDHCVDMGRFIAGSLEAGKRPGQVWAELEKRVAEYRIVD
jgi:protoporphyrinogen oxidase